MIFLSFRRAFGLYLILAVIAVMSEQAFSENAKLRVYTTNVNVMIPVFRAFEKANPRVAVIYDSRTKGNELRNVIRLELKNNIRNFDVAILNLNMDAVGLVAEFKNSGFMAFRPTNLPPHKLHDKGGYWSVIFGTRYILGYDPRVAGSEIPNFSHLMAGKYEFMLDPQDFGWFEGLNQCLGEKAAAEFLGKLAAKNPLLRKGHNLIAMLIVAGEAPAGLLIDSTAHQFRKKGAPLAWNENTDPVVARVAVAVLSKGPNQNLARRFIEFLLSSAGQRVIAEEGAMPVRSGVGSSHNREICYIEPKDISSGKWKELYESYRRILNLR